MGARQTAWGVAAVALAAGTVLVGCQPQQMKSKPAREPAGLARGTTATTQPADEGSAAALARKAEEWAKMMDALRAKREAAATRPAEVADTRPVEPAKPETPPSIVATTQPAPAEKPAGAALVFAAPAATKPVIEIHAPSTPTTQQAHAAEAPPPPKVVVKDELGEKVRDAAKASPRDPGAQLDYQLVRFLKGEQAPELSAMSSLPADDREAIAAIMDGLANYRAILKTDPTGMASRKARPLVEMGERLRTQADLQITGGALCSAVRGYGNYEPLKGQFVEGRENRALLYCEVNGFASRLGDGGMWETRLTQDLVLYRGDTEVWRKAKADEIPDRCRNKRRDFYTMNLVQLPASLGAGSYTLKVTVIDQIANRVAETVVPVTIAGTNLAGAK